MDAVATAAAKNTAATNELLLRTELSRAERACFTGWSCRLNEFEYNASKVCGEGEQV